MIEKIGLLFFVSLLFVVEIVGVLIKIENKSILRILKRLGIDVYVSDVSKYFKILQSINEDVVGFIKIDGVCLCPVMLGDYTTKDINKRFSSIGELHILETKLSKAFKSLSNNDVLLGDLTVIGGSLRNKNYTPMGAKFSLLRQYVHKLKTNNTSTFEVLLGDIKRNFKILSGIDLLIEDLPSFSCKSRLDLISKLRKEAYFDYRGKVNLDNNILVFMSMTDIDIHMVLVVEV